MGNLGLVFVQLPDLQQHQEVRGSRGDRAASSGSAAGTAPVLVEVALGTATSC